MAGNRQYKSDVFSMLLEDPQNALEVFNAVNGTDYMIQVRWRFTYWIKGYHFQFIMMHRLF